MLFIETTLFTEYVAYYLTDDEYAKLQDYLVKKPLKKIIERW